MCVSPAVHHAVASIVRASDRSALAPTCRPDVRVPTRRYPREHPETLRRTAGSPWLRDRIIRAWMIGG
eukprot:6821558-Prymnesium_polylepis.1